jgi:hypothetical protein
MNKHILIEHPTAWCRWKNVNVVIDLKEPHQEKFKNKFDIGYNTITKHFGSANPYKKDDAQQKNIRGGLVKLFVAKTYMPIFVVENQLLKRLVVAKSTNCVSKLEANG